MALLIVVFLDEEDVYICEKVFQATTGFVVLTVTYACPLVRPTWEIRALNGSIITINFSFINLSDSYEDENIEVVLHY